MVAITNTYHYLRCATTGGGGGQAVSNILKFSMGVVFCANVYQLQSESPISLKVPEQLINLGFVLQIESMMDFGSTTGSR